MGEGAGADLDFEATTTSAGTGAGAEALVKKSIKKQNDTASASAKGYNSCQKWKILFLKINKTGTADKWFEGQTYFPLL